MLMQNILDKFIINIGIKYMFNFKLNYDFIKTIYNKLDDLSDR